MLIKFIRNNAPYRIGDTADFRKEAADHYIKYGVAVAVELEKETPKTSKNKSTIKED